MFQSCLFLHSYGVKFQDALRESFLFMEMKGMIIATQQYDFNERYDYCYTTE